MCISVFALFRCFLIFLFDSFSFIQDNDLITHKNKIEHLSLSAGTASTHSPKSDRAKTTPRSDRLITISRSSGTTPLEGGGPPACAGASVGTPLVN